MIAQGNYTEAQLLAALRSSSRDVFYEYTLVNRNDETITTLDITDGLITFDSTFPVMRTFSGTVHRTNDINLYTIDYRVVPWLCLRYGADVIKWPLGKFIVNISENNSDEFKTYKLTGYDLGKIADMYLEDKRYFVETNTVYTNNISQLISSMYSNTDIEANVIRRNYSNEWDIGTSRLTIVNQMLEGIGYNPLWFDETGCAMGKPYLDPVVRSVDMVYAANKQSIITDGISRNTSIFEVPNKFVRWIENPDVGYVISTRVNNDPNNPYSTVSRGRTIVDAEAVNEAVATIDNLDAYVAKLAQEKTMGAEYLTFRTLNMPGHGYKDCLLVEIPQYDISGKYIEYAWEMDLSEGGLMTHKCSKVVDI